MSPNCDGNGIGAAAVESDLMLARFVWEIHAWTIPLLFATGWVIGYAQFRVRMSKKHPDLYEELQRRTRGDEK